MSTTHKANFINVAGAFLFLLPLARHAATVLPLGLIISGILFQGFRYTIKPVLLQLEIETPNRNQIMLRGTLAVVLVVLNVGLIEWLHVVSQRQ